MSSLFFSVSRLIC
jgi:hypothetical protein